MVLRLRYHPEFFIEPLNPLSMSVPGHRVMKRLYSSFPLLSKQNMSITHRAFLVLASLYLSPIRKSHLLTL